MISPDSLSGGDQVLSPSERSRWSLKPLAKGPVGTLARESLHQK